MCFKLINPSHFPPLLRRRQTSPRGGSAAMRQKNKTKHCHLFSWRCGPAPGCGLAKRWKKETELEEGNKEQGRDGVSGGGEEESK